jgi:selenide,water dikinase
MLIASAAEAELDLGTLPLYAGTRALAEQGTASTLLAENLVSARFLRDAIGAATRAIVFDPQTSGGLLAGVPAERAAVCVAELRDAGHLEAASIGRVGRNALPSGKVGIAIRAVS